MTTIMSAYKEIDGEEDRERVAQATLGICTMTGLTGWPMSRTVLHSLAVMAVRPKFKPIIFKPDEFMPSSAH